MTQTTLQSVFAALTTTVLLVVLSRHVLADDFPIGIYSYDSAYADIHVPVVGIASVEGASFVTPGVGVPLDDLDVSLALSLFDQQYPNTVFSIDSGFT